MMLPRPVRTFSKKLPALLLVLAALVGGAAEPRYVFLFIGDGMGAAQRQLAAAFLAATSGTDARLAMDDMPVTGTLRTAAANDPVTDSAAAGTAIACGELTDNGCLGVAPDGRKLTSVAELARDTGMKVGIVATVALNHATPAAFYAHVDKRGDYRAVADMLLASRFDFFGGGGFYAVGDLPVWQAARDAGYGLCRTAAELDRPPPGRVLAVSPRLDTQAAMPYAVDRATDEWSLAAVVRLGIRVLDGPRGFFMMVEGGRVDWACHDNDAGALVREVLDLDAAVREALAFRTAHPRDTLILVTADHETGGLTLGARPHPELLARQRCSADELRRRIHTFRQQHGDAALTAPNLAPVIENALGLALTAAETATLAELAGRPHATEATTDLVVPRAVAILADRAGIRWTGTKHTATPVPLTAVGAGAETFAGSCSVAEFGCRLRRAVIGNLDHSRQMRH